MATLLSHPLSNNLWLYQQIIDDNPSGMVLVDARHPDLPIVYVNKAFERDTGYTADEVIGKNPRFMQGNDRDQEGRVLIRQAIDKQEACTVTIRNYRKDGSLFWNELRLSPLRDEQGMVTHMLGVQNDITERKQAEQEIVEKHAELDHFFNVALDLLCIADTDGNFVKVNKQWESTLGYAVEELERHRFLDFVHPDDLQSTLDAIDQLDQQKPVLYFTNRYRCKDGSYRFIEWRSQPSGKLIYAAARDVTEHKQMEDDLRASEQKFRTFIEQSVDGIALTDEQGVIIEWNQSMATMTGIPIQQALGQLVWDVQFAVAPQHLKTQTAYDFLKSTALQVLQTGIVPWSNVPHETRLFHHNGYTQHIIQEITFPISTSEGYRIGTMFRDVTERRKMEDNLRQSEERLRVIVDNIPLMIAVYDQKGNFEFINHHWEDRLGWSLEELATAEDSLALFYPDPAYRQKVATFMLQAKPGWRDFETITKHHGTINMSWANVRLSDGRSIGIGQDISERKQMEEALHENEERLKTIVDNIPVMIGFFDKNGDVEFINHCWEERLGWTVEDMQAVENPLALSQPDPLQRQQVIDFMESCEPGWQDFETLTKEHGMLTTSWANVRLSDGRRIAIGQDITERKLMEETLRQNAETQRMILEGTNAGTWEWTIPTGESIFNERWAEIVGYTVAELSPINIETWVSLVHPDDLQKSTQLLENHFAGKTSYYDCEVRMKHKDGHWMWVWDRGRVMEWSADRKPLRMFGTHTDITEQKQAQQRKFELALEKERTRLLTYFIRNAAHEFRTPLSIIGANAYLMSRSEDAERRQIKNQQIELQIHRITRLVDMLLLMVKLEAGEELECTPVDIVKLVEAEYQRITANAEGKLRFHHAIQTDLPLVTGDGDSLAEVIAQLMDNAVRFTPDGGTVTISTGETAGQVWVEIADTGNGIPDTDISHIFETFWRKDHAHSTAGFGLGLPIAKRIAEHHGGNITVSSKVGGGTRFRMTFPAVR
jgi:PAS domain S-box-containing protein